MKNKPEENFPFWGFTGNGWEGSAKEDMGNVPRNIIQYCAAFADTELIYPAQQSIFKVIKFTFSPAALFRGFMDSTYTDVLLLGIS